LPDDPVCVPYNIFSTGGVTPAALRTSLPRRAGLLTPISMSWDGKVLVDLSKYGIRAAPDNA